MFINFRFRLSTFWPIYLHYRSSWGSLAFLRIFCTCGIIYFMIRCLYFEIKDSIKVNTFGSFFFYNWVSSSLLTYFNLTANVSFLLWNGLHLFCTIESMYSSNFESKNIRLKNSLIYICWLLKALLHTIGYLI